jgi:hypothetical protein
LIPAKATSEPATSPPSGAAASDVTESSSRDRLSSTASVISLRREVSRRNYRGYQN